jgi:hypothetical protein
LPDFQDLGKEAEKLEKRKGTKEDSEKERPLVALAS